MSQKISEQCVQQSVVVLSLEHVAERRTSNKSTFVQTALTKTVHISATVWKKTFICFYHSFLWIMLYCSCPVCTGVTVWLTLPDGFIHLWDTDTMKTYSISVSVSVLWISLTLLFTPGPHCFLTQPESFTCVTPRPGTYQDLWLQGALLLLHILLCV